MFRANSDLASTIDPFTIRSYPKIRSLISLASFLAVLTMIYLVFKMHDFSYFYVDDFNNLFWGPLMNGTKTILRNLADPSSDFYRPAGMLVYSILGENFGLSPGPFRAALFGLHSLNTLSIFLILRKCCRSNYAAILGSLVFAINVNIQEIYWNFGTIFEVLGGFFFFSGILILIYVRNYYLGTLLLILTFYLGLRSKEMCITFVAIAATYEVLLSKNFINHDAFRKSRRFRIAFFSRYLILGLIAAWFTCFTVLTWGSNGQESHPYYMEISLSSLFGGYSWYLNSMAQVDLSPIIWFLLFLILSAFLVYKRDRQGIFFLIYVLLTLLPVVFLVNHRFNFYWYLPSLGMVGLLGLAVRSISNVLFERFSYRVAITVGTAFFLGFSYWYMTNATAKMKTGVSWARELSNENRKYVAALQQLSKVGPNETIEYESGPPYLDNFYLAEAATKVVLKRKDVQVQLVEKCRPATKNCFHFER